MNEALIHLFCLGLLLPDGGSSQVGENCAEAASAVNPDHHRAGLANGRGDVGHVTAPGRRLPGTLMSV